MKKFLCFAACLSLLLLCGCENAQESAQTETAPAPLQETHLEGTIQVQGEDTPLFLSYYPEGEDSLRGELTIGEQTMKFQNAGTRLGFLDHGFRVADVNQDDLDDVMVDRGFVAEVAYSGCYVQQEDGSFLPVTGFDDLKLPFWSEKGGFLVVPEQLSSSLYCINHYVIQGNQLVPTERLLSDYTSGPLYSVEKMKNGEWVKVTENLTESNIDMDYWYLG